MKEMKGQDEFLRTSDTVCTARSALCIFRSLLAIEMRDLYNSGMEHLITSFNTVMPLLIMMAVGVLLNKTRVASKDVFLIMNRIVYYVGLPCLIFSNLMKERTAKSEGSADIYCCWY